jgi:SAM-dependent methyltransferase
MIAQQVLDIDELKARIKTTWMTGDYARVARFTEKMADEFIDRRRLTPDLRVLDVACGNGNLSIPAAKTGATVVGIDIAPNLLEDGRQRAAREGLKVKFEEGDVERLPYPTGAFDVVVSMFGAMFAPRPDLVANELCRVCRSGGIIAMANWTPGSFIGELFKVSGKHVSPPAGMPSPLLWGDETTVRERFGGRVGEIETTRIVADINLSFSVPETVEFYRLYYGPTARAFASLPEEGQAQLRRDLERLYAEHNQALDGSTSVAAEYLEVVAKRV